MIDLSDKTVLVTGCSKGIGASIAECLGRSGASVVAHYASDRAGAEAATAGIEAARKSLIAADFNDLDQVESLWDEALSWRGRIDALINNAAIMRFDGGLDEPVETFDSVWRQTFEVNVLASARLMRRAVGHYRETGGGIIVTISSWAAQKGVTNPATIAYGASKAAVHAATQTIARAYATDGILAYTIAPGVVRTRMSEQFAATQGGEDSVTDTLAMREWVPPEEIGELAAFLATGSVRHLSGATLDVNGASYVR